MVVFVCFWYCILTEINCRVEVGVGSDRLLHLIDSFLHAMGWVHACMPRTNEQFVEKRDLDGDLMEEIHTYILFFTSVLSFFYF